MLYAWLFSDYLAFSINRLVIFKTLLLDLKLSLVSLDLMIDLARL